MSQADPPDETATTQPSGSEAWASSEWRSRAIEWLDGQLASAGVARTGDVTQPHLRPWATALRAPTTRGVVWLKAAAPGTAFEIGLYELLHRLVPERVLEPIGLDVSRAWIVLPDGGLTLRESCPEGGLVPALLGILPQYAELQRELGGHVAELLALGVSDMRATVMPQRFDEAFAIVARQVERSGSADESAKLERVAALRSTYLRWCAELGAAAGEPSLDHNDLHPGNVFVGNAGNAPAKFYDWGDAVVAHPFSSLLVLLGVVRAHLGVHRDDRQMRNLRDAYLEAFGDLAPHAELVRGLELSCRVGKVARALIWHRAISTLSEQEARDFAGAPLHWLGSLLDESYLGVGA